MLYMGSKFEIAFIFLGVSRFLTVILTHWFCSDAYELELDAYTIARIFRSYKGIRLRANGPNDMGIASSDQPM